MDSHLNHFVFYGSQEDPQRRKYALEELCSSNQKQEWVSWGSQELCLESGELRGERSKLYWEEGKKAMKLYYTVYTTLGKISAIVVIIKYILLWIMV